MLHPTSTMSVILHTENSTSWGGQDMRVIADCAGMAARGHRVALAARPHTRISAEAAARGIEVFPITFRSSADLASIREVMRICRLIRADIVNTHGAADSWCAGIAGRLAGCRVVRTRHAAIVGKWTPTRKVLYSLIPHAVIATGRKLADDLIALRLANPQRVVSIPTGIDTRHFDPTRFSRQEARTCLGLAQHEVVLVMVAMFSRVKRHDLMLQAFAEAARRHPDLRLLLAGGEPPGGSTMADARALVRAAGIEDRVSFLGFRDDIAEVLAASDLLVLTSDSEGLPQSASQAMSMELPVIASRAGGLVEQVDEQHTGWLFEPGQVGSLLQAIESALAARPLWNQMGAAARAKAVADLSIESMLDRTQQLYNLLLANHASCRT